MTDLQQVSKFAELHWSRAPRDRSEDYYNNFEDQRNTDSDRGREPTPSKRNFRRSSSPSSFVPIRNVTVSFLIRSDYKRGTSKFIEGCFDCTHPDLQNDDVLNSTRIKKAGYYPEEMIDQVWFQRSR